MAHLLPLPALPVLIRGEELLLAILIARLLLLPFHVGRIPRPFLPLVTRPLVFTAVIGFRKVIALRAVRIRNAPPSESNKPITVQRFRMADRARLPI